MLQRTQKRVDMGGKEKWEKGVGKKRGEMGTVSFYIDGM